MADEPPRSQSKKSLPKLGPKSSTRTRNIKANSTAGFGNRNSMSIECDRWKMKANDFGSGWGTQSSFEKIYFCVSFYDSCVLIAVINHNHPWRQISSQAFRWKIRFGVRQKKGKTLKSLQCIDASALHGHSIFNNVCFFFFAAHYPVAVIRE